MKKSLFVVAALAIVAAAVYFALFRAPSGEAPGPARVLSAQHTAGFAGVGALDQLAREAEATVKGLPPEHLGPIAPAMDPAKRKELLGFDPMDPNGWAEIGLDPTAGVTVAVDARVKEGPAPAPMLLLRVTDEAKLLAFIEKQSGQKPTVSGDSGARTLELMGNKSLFGARGDMTALLLVNAENIAAVKPGFEQFLADDAAPLSEDAHFATAFSGVRGAWANAYATAAGVQALMAGAIPAEAKAAVDKYAALFPAMRITIGDQGFSGRMVASERGVTTLRKILQPKRRAPDFSKYLPEGGWMALRFSVNLREFQEGITEIVPDQFRDQVSVGLGTGTVAMGAALGVGMEQIQNSFSGHFAVGVDAASLTMLDKGGMPAGVVLVGIEDPNQADEAVKALMEKAKANFPVPVVAKRDGDVLVVGLPDQVDAAIARKDGKNLSGASAKAALGGDVVYGALYDIRPLFELMKKDAPEEAKGLAEAPAVKKLMEHPHVGAAVTLDRHGLLMETVGEGASATMVVGVLAAVAIPAFVKYQERARQVQMEVAVPPPPMEPMEPVEPDAPTLEE